MIKFRMKQEQPSLEDAKLIQLVKKHEFLFNTKNPDYRNLPQRATTWSNIARDLQVNDQIVVQKRWKVLREKFSVAFRKYQRDGNVSSWQYYDSCVFLIPFVNLKPDRKSGGEEDEQELLVPKKQPPKSPFDEGQLIQLVQDRPVLYDKQHEDFRSGNLRKKAWTEVSEASGWDIRMLQKRWRVMRDRFVRELRRTKNIDTDSHVNCTPFFRDMLFLVRHVRSKNYEAEADLGSDASQDHWGYEECGDDEGKFSVEKLETCDDNLTIETVQFDDTAEVIEQIEDYATEETPEYLESFEPGGGTDPDHFNESEGEISESGNYFTDVDDEADQSTAEQNLYVDEKVVAVEEISADQWFKTEEEPVKNITTTTKRQASVEIIEELIPSKRKKSEPFVQQTVTPVRARASLEPAEALDEDAAFGQTIGLMLKKIPPHLKTSLKILFLQCYGDFELKHKLN